jgi:D-alanine-D-alanine ligase
MKVAIIYNKDMSGVINVFGMQNKEKYNPRTVKLVADALEKGGHNVAIIDGNMNVIETLQSFMPKVLDGERLGMVFNMAYGIQGESRYTHIPSLLEMLGIPYVGSTPAGHALALDKVITKIIMQKHGIPTPDFWVFSSKDEDMSGVKYPSIVKPKMESVSFGLKIVYDEESLRESVDFVVNEFKQQALVEEFIMGREFAVGIIGNDPIETFPVLEIDLENDPKAIQSVEDKQKKPREKVCPAKIDPELAEEMKRQSVAAFRALHLRDFARVDIRLDQNNNVHLLEINSMASLGRTGSYVFSAAAHGYDYNGLVNKMLDVAVVRYFANSSLLVDQNGSGKKLPLHTRIRGFLRSREESATKLLQSYIDINSHVRNIEGVNQLSAKIKKQFSQLDFSYEIIPQVEVGHSVYFSNTGHDECDILLLGNLDNNTKINKQEYYHESGQKLFGSGIWEHKGGIVVMLLALQALKYTRVLKKLKVGVLLTSDDTLQGKFARSIVNQKVANSDYVIGLHGAFLNGGIVTSRSGSAVYKCSMNLKKNDDAYDVSKASSVFLKLINSWTELSDPESGLVISPFDVKLDSSLTQPFAHGEVTLSVRFSNSDQFEAVDKKIKKMVPTKFKELLHFQIEGGERRPAMLYTDKVEELWNRIQKIGEKLDIRLKKEHRWSSADIGFVNEGKFLIDGMGPVGIKEHKKNEYILKHSLMERAALLAMTIHDLSNSK